ncbi:hypothetical protein COV24_00495 [candidate division WWE3 bacterium CG10_big_fil_rev_8_21_14_0_10_32_10]|uniref:Uncharacterized protein n=1 Tax=candidate division WWE3 bacterium CG10_big_fil_rev_8_21_14_0_10_32_10 TaxID=1975090 RepID=A0A2H0RBE2_UNCKA|nr:MAG: hypothetical protein COV24_00495 [candidate division WWE3 bacterium CG10_big_fil_rev_8_21_14_0_10_32_10]
MKKLIAVFFVILFFSDMASPKTVQANATIPIVPIGIAFPTAPLERGNREEIVFYSSPEADSLYFSSMLPISEVPLGCTAMQVPVHSLDCEPGSHTVRIFIQKNEEATTTDFFARAWYRTEERHIGYTVGILNAQQEEKNNLTLQVFKEPDAFGFFILDVQLDAVNMNEVTATFELPEGIAPVLGECQFIHNICLYTIQFSAPETGEFHLYKHFSGIPGSHKIGLTWTDGEAGGHSEVTIMVPYGICLPVVLN